MHSCAKLATTRATWLRRSPENPAIASTSGRLCVRMKSDAGFAGSTARETRKIRFSALSVAAGSPSGNSRSFLS